MSFPNPTTQYFTSIPHDMPQFWFNQEQHTTPCHIEYIPTALNRVITCNKFKTRLCPKFGLGTCAFGDQCTFAHGMEDIQRIPDSEKMIPCRMYSKGEHCSYGAGCHFLHDSPCSKANCLYPNRVFRKTKLCYKWVATGYCPYEGRCVYAHGQSELRKLGPNTALEYGDKHSASSEPLPSPSMHKHSASSEPLPSPAIDALPSKSGTRTIYKLHVPRKSCLFKYRRPGKISGIYADWIDDIP